MLWSPLVYIRKHTVKSVKSEKNAIMPKTNRNKSLVGKEITIKNK